MGNIWAPSDILVHHGILGQKWGVRRFQNPDGSLTNAGKKRKEILDKAAKYSKKESNYNKYMADHYKKPLPADTYYSGKDGWKNYLYDNYGDDWKDPEYMKKVFEIDDVKQHALDMIEQDRKMEQMESDNMVKLYEEGRDFWDNKTALFENTSISDISHKDYKLAKKYAKRWDKDPTDW